MESILFDLILELISNADLVAWVDSSSNKYKVFKIDFQIIGFIIIIINSMDMGIIVDNYRVVALVEIEMDIDIIIEIKELSKIIFVFVID